MKPAGEYLRTTTDDTLLETLSHGDSRYPFAYYLEDFWAFDFHCINWHWHPEVEFMTIAEGTVACCIGEEKFELRKGCALFVNSGILHRYEASASTRVPNVVFSPALLSPEKSLIYEKYIKPVLLSSLTYQIFDPVIPWQKKVLQLLDAVYNLQAQAENEMQTACLLLKLWDILYRNLNLSFNGPVSRHVNHKQARLQTMMQYIHDHYRQPLTLKEIAASASISKSSALQIFQDGIHVSPVAYLIEYRLTRAAELLHATEKPVASIAEETGFTSAGYFCRKFKEHYRVSPNAYRREAAAR